MTFIYDAENKQVQASNSGGVVGQYSYDGDGKRVKKYVPSTGETTVFIYDAGGKLIGESSTIVQPTQDAKVAYLTNDHLGSPRINTDANGAVTARHDYHPFGEEISTSHRTVNLNYLADLIRKKFVSYERDEETGLDFAQARYFSGTVGRFSSPDPLQASAMASNPQSWNRYSYALNNPLKYVDPDGMASRPVFVDYNDLSEDEKRILDNSEVKVGKGKNAKVLKGKELYDYMKDEKNKMQKNLANFLNQTAILQSVKFDDGRTALSYVAGVSSITRERIIAKVDNGLFDQIKKVSGKDSESEADYVGPENSTQEHGSFDTSFRENRPYTSQQLSFASSQNFGAADIDIDEECPYCGSKKATVKHTLKVIGHKLTGGQTDPYKVFRRLTADPLKDRKGRGLKPSYNVVD